MERQHTVWVHSAALQGGSRKPALHAETLEILKRSPPPRAIDAGLSAATPLHPRTAGRYVLLPQLPQTPAQTSSSCGMAAEPHATHCA